MKKMFFAAGLIASVFAAKAQTLGVQANGILATNKNSTTSNGATVDFDGKNRGSWKAGVVMTMPIAGQIAFMPQLNILSKGGKIDQVEKQTLGGLSYSYTTVGSLKLTYLELPLNVVYNAGSARDRGFFVGAGPVLSYGLSGKYEATVITEGGIGGPKTSEAKADVKFDGKNDANDNNYHLKAFEFGINAIAGYRLPHGFFVNAHYNLGLSNIAVNSNSKFKNSYAGIGIGYFFGK